MESLQEAIGRKLRWRQTRVFRRHYDLLAGGETVGELARENLLGTRIRARVLAETWEFDRGRFPYRAITFRREGSDVEVGVFRRGLFTARLELAGGKSYRFKRTRWWGRESAFLDREDHPLVRFRVGFNPFLASAEVRVARRADALPELGLLVAAGFYLLVLRRGRSSD